MRASRAFLGRVVRFLAGQAGIRQFLDIGPRKLPRHLPRLPPSTRITSSPHHRF